MRLPVNRLGAKAPFLLYFTYCSLQLRFSLSCIDPKILPAIGCLLPRTNYHYTTLLKGDRLQQLPCYVFRGGSISSSASSSNVEIIEREKPIVVVGGTGRVGRIVVQKLLNQNHPVRVIARDRSKAESLFLSPSSSSLLEIYEADLGKINNETNVAILDECINGCDSIISVMGVVRFASLWDFLPWRIFNVESSTPKWAKTDHPYYGNYLGQTLLIHLAIKYKISRFVRLTGLGLAYSAFNPFTLLFNTLLSCNNVWGLKCEEALIKSNIPYVILRPGGLAEDIRVVTSTNIQIDASGKLPFPGRIGRHDVADLCVASITSVPYNKSYTVACRWVGENIKPKPQGSQSDGYSSAVNCFEQLVQSNATALPPTKMKPYGIAVGITVYTLIAIMLKCLYLVFETLRNLLLPF